MNVVLTGFMGTGKTAVGRRLAKRLGWRFVDLDERIEASAGMTVRDIFAHRGEAVFRRLERRHLAQTLRDSEQVIATGGGALVDAANRARCLACGPVVCLTASPRVILARLGRRMRTRPLLQGVADPRQRVRSLLAKRAGAYAQATLTVATDHATVDDVVERVWQGLSPYLCRGWRYLAEHATELSTRYGGRYVAVVGDRVVAAGASQLEAFRKMPQHLARDPDAGLFYIPQRDEALVAL